MKKIILSGFLSLMATTGLTEVAEATTCSISGSIDFAYTGAIETCTVSKAGLYAVTAVGGAGGDNAVSNTKGEISLISGETISIIVGGGPVYNVTAKGYSYTTGAGGSFIFQGSGSGATPLIVAGGGGGWFGDFGANASVTTSGTAGGSNGGASGGAGGVNGGNGVNFYGQGGEGYLAILNTPTPTNGVFGGGGGGYNGGYGSGGGGGGYSGGGGGGGETGGEDGGGGGGGSFVISTAINSSIGIYANTNYYANGSVDFVITNTTAGSQSGNSIPEPSAIAVFASAIVGLVFARFWLKRKNKRVMF